MPVQEPKNPGDEVAPGTPQSGEAPCRVCNGSGRVESKPCEACGGGGKVIVLVAMLERRRESLAPRLDTAGVGI